MVVLQDARLQARKPHGLGLQVPLGMDDEVSIPGSRWRCREALSGVATGDSEEQGDDDLCGVDQPRPYPYADRDTAADLRVTCGPVSEGEEFAPNYCQSTSSYASVTGANTYGHEGTGY